MTVTHSPIDIGPIQNIFDGDLQTLIRTAAVDPAVIEIEFPAPRTLAGVRVTTGNTDIDLTAEVSSDGAPPSLYHGTFTDLPPNTTVELDFDQPQIVTRLRLEIKAPRANLYLNEIEFK